MKLFTPIQQQKHRCLLSSLVESTDQLEKPTYHRYTKTQQSVERLKLTNIATPKTQMTNRKQLNLAQVQTLLQQSIQGKMRTSAQPWNTSRSVEKTLDLQSMSELKRIKWLGKQQSLLCQQSALTERQGANHIHQMIKATNYNNFIKKFGSEEQMILSQRNTESLQLPKKQVIHKMPSFTFNQPISHIKGMSQHMSRMRNINQESSQQSPQRKLSHPKFELTMTNREKFSKYYKDNSLKQLKSQKRDSQQIFKELHIEDIQYTDLDRARNHPINIALFNMLKDEEMILKQQELEDNEHFTDQEFRKQKAVQEKIDEQTRQEYHRKCYVEFQHPKILTQHPVKQTLKKNIEIEIMQQETKKQLNKKKIMFQIKAFLFKLKELNLTLEDLINGKAFPQNAYINKRAKLFFDFVKSNKTDLARIELIENRFLSYEYDSSKLTTLHHAVIRNHVGMAELLLEYYADVNRKDILGRTPLLFAIKAGHNECVQLLLYHQAIPWNSKKNPYDQYLDNLNEKVRALYRKSKNFHLQMQMMPYSKRSAFWQNRKQEFV